MNSQDINTSPNILNNHPFISQGQAAERQAPIEKTLKIGDAIANIFIEIANFFLRLLCWEPYSLYSAEESQSRVSVQTTSSSGQNKLLDSSSEEDLPSDGDGISLLKGKQLLIDKEDDITDLQSPKSDQDKLSNSKSKEELSSDDDEISLLKVQNSFDKHDVITALQSRKMDCEEVRSLVNRITTQEEAIIFINACQSLPSSILEDNLRNLALSAKERPNVSEKTEIITAFEKNDLVYEDFLPHNHFTKLVSIFNVAIYNNLPLEDLTQLGATHKEVKITIDNYQKTFDVRITQLIELGDIIIQKAHASILRNKRTGVYHSKLCSILVDLKKSHQLIETNKPLLETNKPLKNFLLEYLISEKRPRIECVESQKILLDLFFVYCSDDQLSRFIHKEIFYEIFKGKPSIGNFNECFFDTMTDERIETLLPLLEMENTTIDKNLLYSLVDQIKSIEGLLGFDEKTTELRCLAQKLIHRFYEKRPDAAIWNEIGAQEYGEWRSIRGILVDAKILLLINRYVASSDLEKHDSLSQLAKEIRSGPLPLVDAKIMPLVNQCVASLEYCRRSQLAQEIRNCFKIFPTDSRAASIVGRSIKNILLHICGLKETVGSVVAEEILNAFVRALSYDDEYSMEVIKKSAWISKNPKNETLKLPALDVLVVKALFKSYLVCNKKWESFLVENLANDRIVTEEQINAFIDICLGMTEPLQSVQLSTLIYGSDGLGVPDARITKILQARQLDPDSYSNNINWLIYENSFKAQDFFDKLLKIDSQEKLEEWIAKKKNSETYLYALAAGIKFADGSIIKVPLDSSIIEQAFHKNVLRYDGYAKPIDLYDFLAISFMDH